MSMIDIAVTRQLINALRYLRSPSRADQPDCWCPLAWPTSKGHIAPCKTAREAIHQARLAGY